MATAARSTGAGQSEEHFVRQSSGLVRSLRLRDALVLNFGWTGASFSLSLAFMISQAAWAFPGVNFGIAQILTALLIGPTITLTYALLAVALPRAGGDYVFISRLLHPFVGFVANWGLMVMLAFFVAWGAYWGGAQALSTVLASVGHTQGAGWLVDAGAWVAGTTGALVVALALILLFGAVAAAGTRVFARVNLAILTVGLIGTLVAFGVMLTTSREDFVASFNSFMTNFTDDTAYYQTVLERGSEGGVTTTGGSFGSLVAAVPIVAFSSLFAFGSAYVGNEVAKARRSQLFSMPAALALLAVMNIVTYYIVRGLVGNDFLVSVNSLWFDENLAELPIFPFFNLFATNATTTPVLALLIGLGYLAMSVLFVSMNILLCTRMVFAWSFDRVFPARFAEVNERTHSPLYAVSLVVALAIAFLLVLLYTDWLATLSGIAGALPAFILACVAGAILPWRRRRLFASSSIGGLRVGPVPLITVTGTLGAVLGSALLIAYLLDDRYLVNSAEGLRVIGGIFVLGAAIYVASLLLRRRQGVDVMKASQEVPPA